MHSNDTNFNDPYGSKPLKERSFFGRLLAKNEERETPTCIYNWRLWVTALAAAAGAISIGYDTGFIGGTVALKSFVKEFDLGPHNPNANTILSNIISIFHISAAVGALFSYPVSHWWGRKYALMFASLFVVAGAAVTLAANSDRGVSPLYAGRVISGFGVGFSTNLTVVYLSEIAPPAIRGQMTAAYEIGWRVGDLTGFWISYGVSSTLPESRKQWMIPFAVQLIPAALFFLGSLYTRESPRWLFQVGRDEQAMDNLQYLRQLPADHEYMIYEVNQIKAAVDYQKTTVGLGLLDPPKEIFSSKKLAKRLFITAFLFWVQNFLGIQSINYYSPRIFASLGVKGTNATLFSTGMFGVVKFIFTNSYILFIVDNFGRKPAFMTCSTICTLAFIYIGAYIKIQNPLGSGHHNKNAGNAAIAMMYIWIASFTTAWSGGPYVVGTELWDQNLRAFVQAVNACCNWLPTFILARLTINMIDTMHYGIYFFYASISLLSIPYVFFLIPESKGIPLEDIDKLFAPGLPAWRAHKVVFKQIREETAQALDEAEQEKLFDIKDPKANVEYVENASSSN